MTAKTFAELCLSHAEDAIVSDTNVFKTARCPAKTDQQYKIGKRSISI